MATVTDTRSAGLDVVRSIWTMLVAGALSTIAFDFFGQSLSPMLGFSGLAPVPLATQVVQVLTGETLSWAGHGLHYLAGMIAYPLGWMLIVDPLRKRFGVNWLVAAVAYGVALWVFALFVMAHLVAGNPPFLGFAQITRVALVGHVLFAVVTAAVVLWRERTARAA